MALDVEGLFREHNVALYRYLLRVTGGDEATARDAVQHAFLRMLERPPDETSPKAWLYRVATNAVRDWSAQERRREALMEQKSDAAPRPRREDTPEEALARRRELARVREALQALPEKERVILLMREEGFKHREIAEAVGTTTGSIGTMIARALERLAGRLELDATEGAP